MKKIIILSLLSLFGCSHSSQVERVIIEDLPAAKPDFTAVEVIEMTHLN